MKTVWVAEYPGQIKLSQRGPAAVADCSITDPIAYGSHSQNRALNCIPPNTTSWLGCGAVHARAAHAISPAFHTIDRLRASPRLTPPLAHQALVVTLPSAHQVLVVPFRLPSKQNRI